MHSYPTTESEDSVPVTPRVKVNACTSTSKLPNHIAVFSADSDTLFAQRKLLIFKSLLQSLCYQVYVVPIRSNKYLKLPLKNRVSLWNTSIEFGNMSKSTTSLGNFTKTHRQQTSDQQNMSNVILRSILKHKRYVVDQGWIHCSYADLVELNGILTQFLSIERSTKSTVLNRTTKVFRRTKFMKVFRK